MAQSQADLEGLKQDQAFRDQSTFQIGQRASAMPQDFVKDAPFTATWLIGSSLPTQTVQTIGKGLQDVWPWIKAQNGPDGMYVGARANALQQPDPMIRRINLLQIDAASDISHHQLTNAEKYGPVAQPLGDVAPPSQPGFPATAQGKPETQLGRPADDPLAHPMDVTIPYTPARVYVLSILQGSDIETARRNAALDAQLLGMPGAEAEKLVEGFGGTGLQLSPQLIADTNLTPVTPGERNVIDWATGVKPEMTLRLTQQNAAAALQLGVKGVGLEVGAPFMAGAAVLKGVVGGGLAGAGNVTAAGLDAVGLHSAAQNVSSALHTASRGVGRGLTAAEGAINYGFGRVTDVIGGGLAGIPAEVSKGIQGKPTGVGDWWHKYVWPSAPGTGTGEAVADTLGLSQNNPFRQGVVQGANLAAQIYIGGELFKGIAGFREAGQGPGPLDQPFGMSRDAYISSFDTPEAQDAAGAKWDQTLSDLQTAQPAFQKGLQQRFGRLGRLLYNLRDKTPGEWANDPSSGLKVFNKLADKVPYGTTDRAAKLIDVTKGVLSPDQARLMAGAPDGPAMARAWESTLEHTPDLAAIERDTSRAMQLRDIIAENAKLKVGDPNLLDPSTISHYQAELAQIEQRLANPTPADVGWTYPKPSTMRLLKLKLGDSAFLRSLEAKAGFGSTPLRPLINAVSLLTDQLHQGGLQPWDAISATAKPDALRNNVEYLTNTMNRARVPSSEITRIVQGMLDVKDPADFMTWSEDYARTVSESPAIAPDMKASIFQMFDGSESSNRAGFMDLVTSNTDGTVSKVFRNVGQWIDDQGNPHSIPMSSSEMLRRLNSIDINRITEATSFTQTLMRRLGRIGEKPPALIRLERELEQAQLDPSTQPSRLKALEDQVRTIQKAQPRLIAQDLAKAGVGSYRFLKFVSQAGTAVLKPLDLVLRTPAIIERAGLEHQLRMAAGGYDILGVPSTKVFGIPKHLGGPGILRGEGAPSVTRFNRPSYAAGGLRDVTIFNLPDTKELGGLVTSLTTDPGTQNLPHDFNLSKWKNPDAPIASLIPEDGWRAIYNRLRNIQAAPELRALVAMDGNVGAWVRWLKDENGPGKQFLDLLKSNISKAFGKEGTEPGVVTDAMLRQFGENWNKAIDFYTGGNVRLREAISTEHWGDAVKESPRGETPQEELARLSAAVDQMQAKINDAHQTGDPESVQALELARQEDIARLRELRATVRQQAGEAAVAEFGRPQPDTSGVHFSNEPAFIAKLKREYEAGTYDLPEQVTGYVDRVRLANRKEAAMSRSQWFANRMYGSKWFQSVGHVDQALSRERFYRQVARDVYDKAKSLGWSDREAQALAEVQAARRTGDFFYNLTARSSADRFLRNVFWFAPVTESALRSWLVDIPSRYYPILGHAFLYNRAHLFTQFFTQTGLVKKDANGNDVFILPGGALLSKLTGTPVKDILSVEPRQLSMLTSGGLGRPSLSPEYGAILGQLARTHGGIFKSLSNTLQPYGQDVSFGPSALAYAYEAITGKQVPWEFASQDYQQSQYDSGFDDAVRQAFAELEQKGIKPPLPQDYGGNTTAYYNASVKYRNLVFSEAKDRFRAFSLIRLLGSTVTPAPLHITDQYKEDLTAMYQAIYGPNDNLQPKDKTSPAYQAWSDNRAKLFQEFSATHPYSFAYTVAKSVLNDPTKTLPAAFASDTGFQKYKDELYTGYRQNLDPMTYIQMVSGWESYQHYISTKETQIAQAVGKPSYDAVTPSDWLLHSGNIALLTSSARQQWGDYLAANPQFNDEYTRQQQLAARNGKPIPGSGLLALENIQDGLRALEPFFSVDGVRTGDIKTIERGLGQQIGAMIDASPTGTPGSKLAQGLQWYRDNVMTPFFAQTDPLWAKEAELKNQGLDPTAVLNQIQDITTSWDSRTFTHDGITYPSPEQTLFGSLRQGAGYREQDNARLKWASQPATWLTPFQRQQAGYPDSPQIDQLLQAIRNFDQQLKSYEDSYRGPQGGGISSDYKAQLQAWRDQKVMAVAKTLGPQAVRVAQMSMAPPIFRILNLHPEYAQNPMMQFILSAYQYISKQAASHQVSLRGDNPTNAYYKDWFFRGIGKAIAMGDPNNPSSTIQEQAFNQILQDLGVALATKGADQTSGPDLYNKLFFNDYGGSYAPPPTFNPQTQSYGNTAVGTGAAVQGQQALEPIAIAAAKAVGVPEQWATDPNLWLLLQRESGVRPTAQNPTSSAYGLFQFLDSTWQGYGVAKTSDPYGQFEAGFKYIKARYGSPAAALQFDIANGWF